jgi:hypothetical protein
VLYFTSKAYKKGLYNLVNVRYSTSVSRVLWGFVFYFTSKTFKKGLYNLVDVWYSTSLAKVLKRFSMYQVANLVQ